MVVTTAVNAEFEVQGGKEYVVIPTTFRPNQEAQFNLTVFSRLADNITLSPLHDSAENLVFVRDRARRELCSIGAHHLLTRHCRACGARAHRAAA